MLTVNYSHITKLKNSAACLERFPRIRVAQIVMDYLAYGWSVEEMCHQHPYLSLAEAHAAMAYYFDISTIKKKLILKFERIGSKPNVKLINQFLLLFMFG